MKTKTLLVPFLAVFTLLLVSFTAATIVNNDGTVEGGSLYTTFNGVELDEYTSGPVIAGDVDSMVPVRVTFTADDNVSDVRIEVSMDGFRDDVEAETSRFDIVDGSTYTKLLSLRLPSDADDLTEDYTLKVRVTHKGSGVLAEYDVKMQRESYTLDVLSVDYSSSVEAGDVFPISVVVKNTGFNRADDNYVVVSIPELGVSTRGYIGDLVATECSSCDKDEEDSVQKTVYLKVPDYAEMGVYDLEVTVYNDDSEVTQTQLVKIGQDASATVLAASNENDLKAGETVTYDMVIVNSGDSVRVFNIETVSSSALTVAAPSVVTVGPQSSQTVQVAVTASDDAEVGTYTFSVNVDGEQVVFGANVTEGSVNTSVVALTVILAIVFVVLLVVLIILLTRKDETKIEEVETSYY